MCCTNNSNSRPTGRSSYVLVLVLYILLVIILGSNM